MKYLLEHGSDVNAVDTDEPETCLNIACAEFDLGNFDQLERIHLLLNNGAKIEQFNNVLCNAICWKNRTLVEVLLANGAEVNIVSDEGYSPLYYAKLRRQKEIEKLLLSFGASQEFISPQGISISDLDNEEIRLKEFINWYYPDDEIDEEHDIID